MNVDTEEQGSRDLPAHLEALTEQQRSFVLNLVHRGMKQGKAAEAAGSPPSSAATTASRWMKNRSILNAIREEALAEDALDLLRALKTRRELMEAAQSEHVRLEASKDVLNRAGVGKDLGGDDGSVQVVIQLGG